MYFQETPVLLHASHTTYSILWQACLFSSQHIKSNDHLETFIVDFPWSCQVSNLPFNSSYPYLLPYIFTALSFPFEITQRYYLLQKDMALQLRFHRAKKNSATIMLQKLFGPWHLIYSFLEFLSQRRESCLSLNRIWKSVFPQTFFKSYSLKHKVNSASSAHHGRAIHIPKWSSLCSRYLKASSIWKWP